jgi:FkbM family methyltransferase
METEPKRPQASILATTSDAHSAHNDAMVGLVAESTSISVARRALRPILGRRRLQPAFSALHRLSLAGMNFGPSETIETGEIEVLKRLRNRWKGRSIVVFDVGANRGDWAREALSSLNVGELHCFEPSAAARDQLKSTLRRSGLHIHPFALGEAEGEAELHSDAPGSGLASLHNRDLKHHGHRFGLHETVQVRRLDSFCHETGINQIDLLKIDVEGSELAVLRGAGGMLGTAIDAIQFEFGTTIEARVFFKDFFQLLDPHYRIYRIIQDGLVLIDSYREQFEIFLTVNYLCLSR